MFKNNSIVINRMIKDEIYPNRTILGVLFDDKDEYLLIHPLLKKYEDEYDMKVREVIEGADALVNILSTEIYKNEPGVLVSSGKEYEFDSIDLIYDKENSFIDFNLLDNSGNIKYSIREYNNIDNNLMTVKDYYKTDDMIYDIIIPDNILRIKFFNKIDIECKEANEI